MQDHPLTLALLLRRAERLFPDKAVVTYGDGDGDAAVRTNYGEWAERTRRLSDALDRLGLAAGARVATFAWNTARHLELYFAVPCSGRVVHTLNVRMSDDQLAFVVNQAGDEALFVDRSLLGRVWSLVDACPSVRHVVVMGRGGRAPEVPHDPRVVDYEGLLAGARPAAFDVGDEGRAAAMCHTSATTGAPRGVVYSHRSLVLQAMALMMTDTMGISEPDVVLPVVPMFHANAWGLAHAGVFAGSTLVFLGPDLSPGRVIDVIERERVTFAAGVPTVWMGALPLLEGRDVASLRAILSGGSAVPRALSEAYRERIGLPLLHAWGMTETSPTGAVCRVRSSLAARPPDELASLRAAQGLPVPGMEARIVAPSGGGELAWDGKTAGELQVRGPWVASGYLDDPDDGASFTADGWLRTGDVATVDPHGYIRLVDRTKDLVKSGGEWISSVDLENEIMAHPKVAEAAVVAVADDRWGERPLACVVPRAGESVTGEEILRFLRPRLPGWWLPDEVVFLDEIPRTSVGKFSKAELRRRFAGGRTPAPGSA